MYMWNGCGAIRSKIFMGIAGFEVRFVPSFVIFLKVGVFRFPH